MRGLDPRIHLRRRVIQERWIAGSSPAMTGLVSIKSETAIETWMPEIKPGMMN
jgi:hypothetical protein